MKKDIALFTTTAFFILCFKISTWHGQTAQKLLVGKWQSGSVLVPNLEFKADSSVLLL